ncbi:MAG: YhbY family RNA-binding protein [Spirochaetales bacterium]|nr:YhbY family RNA-binding protein [Spirochaetales bacterium]
MKLDLTGTERRYLMKKAHSLRSVVMIGKAGAVDGVANALDEALKHHELVKSKFIGFKEEKDELAQSLADRTKSALVQIIGNKAVFYRANPDLKESKYILPRN